MLVAANHHMTHVIPSIPSEDFLNAFFFFFFSLCGKLLFLIPVMSPKTPKQHWDHFQSRVDGEWTCSISTEEREEEEGKERFPSERWRSIRQAAREMLDDIARITSVVASMHGWMDGWVDGRREGEKDGVICLGKVGDVVCAKITKWCLSELVSGRGKEENAKH